MYIKVFSACMMRPDRWGACKGMSRGVSVLEGVNTPTRGVDKTLVMGVGPSRLKRPKAEVEILATWFPYI